MNTVFYGLEGFEGVKEGCEGEVQSENLAGGDWARCGSPPMTPGMFEIGIRSIHSLYQLVQIHNANNATFCSQ